MRPGIRLLTEAEAARFAGTVSEPARSAQIQTLNPSLLCVVCRQLASAHLIARGARNGKRSYQYDPPVLLSVCRDCLQQDQALIHQIVQRYFPFAVGIRLS